LQYFIKEEVLITGSREFSSGNFKGTSSWVYLDQTGIYIHSKPKIRVSKYYTFHVIS